MAARGQALVGCSTGCSAARLCRQSTGLLCHRSDNTQLSGSSEWYAGRPGVHFLIAASLDATPSNQSCLHSKMTRATHLTSSPLCTKLAATKSNLCRTAKLTRSSMSLLVSTGRSTCTPGRLTFLFWPMDLQLRQLWRCWGRKGERGMQDQGSKEARICAREAGQDGQAAEWGCPTQHPVTNPSPAGNNTPRTGQALKDRWCGAQLRLATKPTPSDQP